MERNKQNKERNQEATSSVHSNLFSNVLQRIVSRKNKIIKHTEPTPSKVHVSDSTSKAVRIAKRRRFPQIRRFDSTSKDDLSAKSHDSLKW